MLAADSSLTNNRNTSNKFQDLITKSKCCSHKSKELISSDRRSKYQFIKNHIKRRINQQIESSYN